MDWISYILGLMTLPLLIAALGLIYALVELHLAHRTGAASDSLVDPTDTTATPTPAGFRSVP